MHSILCNSSDISEIQGIQDKKSLFILDIENAVRKEMSQYFFYTCQSYGKKKISFIDWNAWMMYILVFYGRF